MGSPAIILNDRVVGTCAIHQVPNPSSGAPQPSPPMPFSAPLTRGLATGVRIGGRPVAVMGSSGLNAPPHVGLHASDPFFSPSLQEGRVVSGSPSVRIEGKPAANAASNAMCCATPGSLTPSVANVLIG